MAQTYTISTISGIDRLVDGLPATSVPLLTPNFIALDSLGNINASDTYDYRVRRISPSGDISTLAGNFYSTSPQGTENVPAETASVDLPLFITADGLGNVYFFESYFNRIRKVSPNGLISTFAGKNGGSSDDGVPATDALICGCPMAADAAGNVFVAAGDQVRKIGLDGIIRTVAGSGKPGSTTVLSGPALQVNLSTVLSLTADAAGNVYFSDFDFGLVRKLSPDGSLTTVAGALTGGVTPNGPLPATSASIVPASVATDGEYLYIISHPLDYAYLYRVSLATGLLDVLAGGPLGYSGDGGPASLAHFGNPSALVAGGGAVYISDGDHIRRIRDDTIANFAGEDAPDGVPATQASLFKPHNLSRDPAGNLLFVNQGGSAVERIGTDGIIHRVTGPWVSAYGVTTDSKGNTYVSGDGGQFYRISPTGNVTLLAGTGTEGYSGDGGPALQAMFHSTDMIAADSAGNLFVGDSATSQARKISAATGMVTTVLGNGTNAYLGDDVPPVANGFFLCGIAVDSSQNLYVGDIFNSRVFRLAPSGKLSTFAGDGRSAESGDGGPATKASLAAPCNVTVGSDGRVYVGDISPEAGTVRRIDANGIISTIAGNGALSPASGDGGPARMASLDPHGLAVDPFGVVFVADSTNDRIRRIEPPGAPHAIALASPVTGTGVSGQSFSLTLKVTDQSGSPVAAVPVTFTAAPAASASFDPATANTAADGTASTIATLGPALGTTTITATVPGLPSAVLSLTVSEGPSGFAVNGVVGAGLSSPPVQALSPNGLITIFGQGLAPAGTSKQVGTSDLINGRLPFILAGVCIRFGSDYGYPLYVSPTQINAQVPSLASASGNVEVQIVRNCTAAGETSSDPVPVPVQAAAPEFFYFSHPAGGPNPVAAFEATTGAAVTPSAPAYAGDVLTLYGTGFGLSNPPVDAGVLPDQAFQLANPVTIQIGGVALMPSDVLYAGVSSFAGVYQLNIRVPSGIATGQQPIVVTIGGIASPSSASLTIGSH